MERSSTTTAETIAERRAPASSIARVLAHTSLTASLDRLPIDRLRARVRVRSCVLASLAQPPAQEALGS